MFLHPMGKRKQMSALFLLLVAERERRKRKNWGRAISAFFLLGPQFMAWLIFSFSQ